MPESSQQSARYILDDPEINWKYEGDYDKVHDVGGEHDPAEHVYRHCHQLGKKDLKLSECIMFCCILI